MLQQPGDGPLHLPSMSSQPPGRLHSAAGDPSGDATRPQRPPATTKVIGLVGVQPLRTPPWPADPSSHRPDPVDQPHQLSRVHGCWPPIPARPTAAQRRPRSGGTWSPACRDRWDWRRPAPRSQPERRYGSGHKRRPTPLRPRPAAGSSPAWCCPCRSGRADRPGETAPSSCVVPSGMTGGMTDGGQVRWLWSQGGSCRGNTRPSSCPVPCRA